MGAPGCVIHASCGFTLTTRSNSSGVATLSIAIPNTPALVSSVFYTQGLVIDPGANPVAT